VILFYAICTMFMPVNSRALTFIPFIVIPLLIATIVDIQSYRIPNWSNAVLAIAGIIWLRIDQPQNTLLHIYTAIFIYTLLWMVSQFYHRIKGKAGLGMGDVKLLTAGALWLGPVGVFVALFIASLSGIMTVLTLHITTKRALNSPLPFGPFISFALYAVWLSLNKN